MTPDMLRLMRDPHLLPPEKQALLSRIAGQSTSMNMPCYLVGGFVRDLLLGRPSNDLDIIVEGDAIELGDALVRKYGGKLTAHHKFHTAVWTLERDILDLISARSESYPYPGALPVVKPSNIDADLRRRDFTMNAMAIRVDGEHFGELLDPLDGQTDLENKIIRVLHPRSFMDDPTRIFRAVRYAARYSFLLQPATHNLVNPESLAILKNLSGERIRREFDLILAEQNFHAMMSQLSDLGLFTIFDPNLPGFNKTYAKLPDRVPAEELGISENRVLLGYILWLLDAPVQAVEALSRRLYFTSEMSRAVLAGVLLKHELLPLKNSKPSTWTFRLEQAPLTAVYALWLAAGEPELKDYLAGWRHMKPKTTGDDLKALGLPPGPRYRKILTQLRAAWLDGEVKNIQEEKELLNTLIA